MMGKITKLEIDKIKFWLNNSRFGECKNEKEAVKKLSSTTHFNDLVKSIKDNSFQANELITVAEDKKKQGQYIVYDGNRRLAAIKQLARENPKAYKTLHVFHEDDEAKIRIIQKRAHGSDPASRLRWTTVQQARHAKAQFKQGLITKPTVAAECLDILEKNIGGSLDTEFPLTTFERLYSFDKNIKNYTNINIKNIHTDIRKEKINSRNINTNKNKRLYLQNIKKGLPKDARTNLNEDNISEESVEKTSEGNDNRLLAKDQIALLSDHIKNKNFIAEIQRASVSLYPHLLMLASRAILDTLHNKCNGFAESDLNKTPKSFSQNDVTAYFGSKKEEGVTRKNINKYIDSLCRFAHFITQYESSFVIRHRPQLNQTIDRIVGKIEEKK